MQAVTLSTYDCIKAFSETDFTEDPRKLDVPTLIIHGDDNQNCAIAAAARLSSKLFRGAILKGASHGLAATRADQFDADLRAFIRA